MMVNIPLPLLHELDKVAQTKGYVSRNHAMIEAIRLFIEQADASKLRACREFEVLREYRNTNSVGEVR